MPTYMMRALVNGKMIGHPVEAESEEEAKAYSAPLLFAINPEERNDSVEEAEEMKPLPKASVVEVALFVPFAAFAVNGNSP